MAKSLEQLREQFAGKRLARCMGHGTTHVGHAKGTCTADKDYQRLIKLEKELTK